MINASFHAAYKYAKEAGNLRFGRPCKPNVKFIDRKKKANKEFCRSDRE